MNNTPIIKNAAQGRWCEIFEYLAPNLSPAIGNLGRHVPDPVVGGKDGFRLFKDAPQTGAAFSNQEGAFTDGFATLMYALQCDFNTAKGLVADYLRIDVRKTVTTVLLKPAPILAQTPSWELSKEEQKTRSAKLNSVWRQSSPMSKKSSERVVKYLRSRGIQRLDLTKVQTFRFHSSMYYKDELGATRQAPAFVQMFQAPDGTPVNMHKILLSVKTDGKAELDKPKLMMKPSGRMTGGAIRIGEPQNGRLSVATGVETALSVTEKTGLSCWATLNDSLLRGFIPPDGIVHLTIWADNDQLDRMGRNSGLSSASALIERLRTERPEIKIVLKIPPVQGSDWNCELIKSLGGQKNDL